MTYRLYGRAGWGSAIVEAQLEWYGPPFTFEPLDDLFKSAEARARLEKVNNNLLEALYVPAERRVMRRLLDLCELYEGDDQRIMIPVTQETLASIAGTTRPTANQVLRRLVASEIVAVNRSQITVVNRSGLQHLASGAALGR